MELESLSADYLSLISGGAGGAGGGAPPFSDITFCVEGQHVPAHRCILAARSHFFKLMFSHHFDPSSLSHPPLPTSPLLRPPPSAVLPHLFVPLDVVGFDVFVTLLRFLYSGQLILSPPLSPSSVSSPCALPSCPHSSCSYAIDLLLQLIPAAHFFGVPQLADVVQTRLGSVLEEGVSMESWMKVLVMAKKHKMQHVWHLCADLVINSGLDCDVMRRFLPREVIAELAETRLQRSGCMQNNVQIYDHVHPSQNLSNSLSSCGIMCSINAGSCCSDEQKILRLQQALDCMDVELVRLMVMGEGLNLDKALALHYSVANCNREVVKALLELGVVDVNYSDSLGRTALHLAADMGNAEMIAVLLDHHADPNVLTHDGFAAVDILRGLIKATGQDHFHHDQQPVIMPPLCKADQKRIHLCIELLQSAAAVAGREEPAESSCVTQAAAQIFSTNLNQDAPAFMSCGPGVLLAGGMPVSCGLRFTEGSEAPAVPIIRNHDRVRSTANGTQSSQFDAVSCPLHLLGDGMQSIIAPQLAPGSSSLGSISAAVRIDKVKHATSICSSELHHFNNHAQMTAQIQHMNVISGETRSVISPRVVSHNVNHGNIYQGSAGYPGRYEDMQSTAMTESGSTNRAAAQDGQPMNAGTGSSSEE